VGSYPGIERTFRVSADSYHAHVSSEPAAVSTLPRAIKCDHEFPAGLFKDGTLGA
jgi:hypothetical protein